MSCVDPLDWFPEKCYWSGLDEAPSGTLEDYRGALRDINGDSLFTQPPLQFVEIWLQVADEQLRLVGRGYDGRVVRLEGQLDVVRRWGHVVDIQSEEDRGDHSTLSYPSTYASTRRLGCLEGRFERPTLRIPRTPIRVIYIPVQTTDSKSVASQWELVESITSFNKIYLHWPKFQKIHHHSIHFHGRLLYTGDSCILLTN